MGSGCSGFKPIARSVCTGPEPRSTAACGAGKKDRKLTVPPPVSFFPVREDIMKICGACERELPDDSYSEEQRGRRQSSRLCQECVAAGNQLVLMKKGRTRSEGDDCPICSLPLPLDFDESMFQACCMSHCAMDALWHLGSAA